MSDDELFGRRPRKQRRSSGASETAKTLLIAFGILGALGVLACCGVFGAGYYIWQKNFSRIGLTQPADIQKVTAEITDIAIPTEFVPTFGNSILGIKSVVYQWCPTGTCPPESDQSRTLLLNSFDTQAHGPAGDAFASVSDVESTDEDLKQWWFEHTRSEVEVDIRGKKCKFLIVRGEQLDFSAMEGAMPDNDGQRDATAVGVNLPAEQQPQPNTGLAAPVRKGVGHRTVQIRGSFPGKTGSASLQLDLPEADYQEEKILGMLRSIR